MPTTLCPCSAKASQTFQPPSFSSQVAWLSLLDLDIKNHLQSEFLPTQFLFSILQLTSAAMLKRTTTPATFCVHSSWVICFISSSQHLSVSFSPSLIFSRCGFQGTSNYLLNVGQGLFLSHRVVLITTHYFIIFVRQFEQTMLQL